MNIDALTEALLDQMDAAIENGRWLAPSVRFAEARAAAEQFVNEHVAPLIAEWERAVAADALDAAAEHATTSFTELLDAQDVIDSLRRQARRIRAAVVSGEPCGHRGHRRDCAYCVNHYTETWPGSGVYDRTTPAVSGEPNA